MTDSNRLGIDNPADRTVLYTYDEVDALQGRSFATGLKAGRKALSKDLLTVIRAGFAENMEFREGRPFFPEATGTKVIDQIMTILVEGSK